MPEKRVNPNRVRLHRSYSVAELADCCGVHRNTVRNWRDKGLEPIDAQDGVPGRGVAWGWSHAFRRQSGLVMFRALPRA